jgi:uncharacterized protein YggE
MRRWLTAVTVAAAALVAAGIVGIAGADTAATTQRSISVNGFGQQSPPANADRGQLAATYHAALGDALDNAQSKAQLVAQKEGVTLGAVQNVTEETDGYFLGCAYVVGLAAPATGAPAAGGTTGGLRPSRPPRPARPKSTKPKTVKGAQVQPADCPIQASVTVTYLMS